MVTAERVQEVSAPHRPCRNDLISARRLAEGLPWSLGRPCCGRGLRPGSSVCSDVRLNSTLVTQHPSSEVHPVPGDSMTNKRDTPNGVKRKQGRLEVRGGEPLAFVEDLHAS